MILTHRYVVVGTAIHDCIMDLYSYFPTVKCALQSLEYCRRNPGRYYTWEPKREFERFVLTAIPTSIHDRVLNVYAHFSTTAAAGYALIGCQQGDNPGNCYWTFSRQGPHDLRKDKFDWDVNLPEENICDNNTQFASGAQRGSDEKHCNLELVMRNYVAMRRLGETFEEGNQKYNTPGEDENYKKGIPQTNLISHCLEHIRQYEAGDASEDHLAHAAFNLMAAMWNEEECPSAVDIPTRHEKFASANAGSYAMVQTPAGDFYIKRYRRWWERKAMGIDWIAAKK